MFEILHIDAKGGYDIIGLQPVKAKGKGRDQGNGKNNAQPAGVQRPLNIVSRASLKGISLFLLIDLRQRTLYKRRRGTQNRHKPHPESRAGASHDDRGRHTRHVSRADAGSRGDHQCLKGRDTLVPFLFLHHTAQGISKPPHLDEAGPD